MTNNKNVLLVAALLAAASLAVAEDSAPKATNSTSSTNVATTNSIPLASGKQADAASKTAKFEAISKTSDLYKTALDAHALDAAAKQADKEGAFKGTVTKIFEPRGGAMAIVNFDNDYKTALTALLRKNNFDKFPVLTNLVGKEVVVKGKFIDFQGRTEIVLGSGLL